VTTLADVAETLLEVLLRARAEPERRRANDPATIAKRNERQLRSRRGWIDEDGVLQGGLMAFIRHHRWSPEGRSEQGHGSGPRRDGGNHHQDSGNQRGRCPSLHQPHNGRMAHVVGPGDVNQRLACFSTCNRLLPLMRRQLGLAAEPDA
jgi:hypothetical protein